MDYCFYDYLLEVKSRPIADWNVLQLQLLAGAGKIAESLITDPSDNSKNKEYLAELLRCIVQIAIASGVDIEIHRITDFSPKPLGGYPLLEDCFMRLRNIIELPGIRYTQGYAALCQTHVHLSLAELQEISILLDLEFMDLIGEFEY